MLIFPFSFPAIPFTGIKLNFQVKYCIKWLDLAKGNTTTKCHIADIKKRQLRRDSSQHAVTLGQKVTEIPTINAGF